MEPNWRNCKKREPQPCDLEHGMLLLSHMFWKSKGPTSINMTVWANRFGIISAQFNILAWKTGILASPTIERQRQCFKALVICPSRHSIGDYETILLSINKYPLKWKEGIWTGVILAVRWQTKTEDSLLVIALVFTGETSHYERI